MFWNNQESEKGSHLHSNNKSKIGEKRIEFRIHLKDKIVKSLNIENKVFDGSNFNTQFNVQHLPNGVYLLKVNTTQGIATKKIVVNH